MNKQESEKQLRLIHEMIDHAKMSMRGDGFYYLLWGWVILIACISQYLLEFVFESPFAYLPWIILPMIGGITSMINGQKRKKTMRVKTYLHNLMFYFWLAFIISIFMVLITAMLGQISYQSALIIIVIFYGLATFVMGGVLKFKPLIIGGISSWCIALIMNFVSPEVTLLLTALAITSSYLVPGYLLKYGQSN